MIQATEKHNNYRDFMLIPSTCRILVVRKHTAEEKLYFMYVIKPMISI